MGHIVSLQLLSKLLSFLTQLAISWRAPLYEPGPQGFFIPKEVFKCHCCLFSFQALSFYNMPRDNIKYNRYNIIKLSLK